ncbi:MAG: hypothetical protein AAF089_18630 [Bacteroidota bacterium]
MDDTHRLLDHLLATLVYRTQKALRGAPPSFGSFSAGQGVRTPQDLVRHMSAVLNHARAFLGGPTRLNPLPTHEEEVARFFEVAQHLRDRLAAHPLPAGTTPERLVQGPLSDALTHAGQLALLRRLAGAPIPPENFHDATIE